MRNNKNYLNSINNTNYIVWLLVKKVLMQLKKLKTWLRTLLVQDRFSNLSILYIEKDIMKNIKSDDILSISANTNSNYFQIYVI
jgi:hypothetical protein